MSEPAAHPEIAAIVVTYQCGPELEACLQSLQTELSGTPHELWIVDNDSGDGTADRAERAAPGATVVRMPRNAGFAAANDVALAKSTARAFLLINPDAALLPGALGALRAAAAQPGIGAVAPQLLAGDGSILRSCRTFPSAFTVLCDTFMLDLALPRDPVFDAQTLGPFDYTRARDVDVASGACLYVPRATLDAVGPMDDGYFMYYEETDWCRRMRDAGLRVRFEPAARAQHLGQKSSGASQARLIPESYRSQRKYFSKHGGPGAVLWVRALTPVACALRIAAFALRRLAGQLDGPGFALRARAFARAGLESLGVGGRA